ncbi:FadR/GntR family transcriptional regulator [Litoreibacter roseus]|uniref:GntR family transcriptional regulator n=1 Tax=Litoreibacter roseus TaxID=2601869 RepID=A0A6N6JL43_9RHOB|nr:FadR/GntR family transcriptional regulator [Litoreibacter roseus]GFE66667.1 GntR family transcriptional regulator [Litoreibacter roseus]
MKIDPSSPKDLSAQIAQAIRDAIVAGKLIVDARLPSETELSDQFNVSRSTVREALKRLAAQSLIRTQRGATGGAFVNRLTFEDAQAMHVTTSTLLLSMNDVSFTQACEARYALERACAVMACTRRESSHLEKMKAELGHQAQDELSDEAFCASDVAFHRALVDSASNPVLSYQLAGAVEAMQPLMNMITFTARSRVKILMLHGNIVDALEQRDPSAVKDSLDLLESYTQALAEDLIVARPSG